MLARRLVAIYKSDAPDLTTVLLEADGFSDLLTRTEYLQQINDADTVAREPRAGAAQPGPRPRSPACAPPARPGGRRGPARGRRPRRDRRHPRGRRSSAPPRWHARTRRPAGLALDAALAHGRLAGAGARAAGGDGHAGRRRGQTVEQWFDGFAIPKAIVMCESGGNYGALNPSSGAGGAYQFLP